MPQINSNEKRLLLIFGAVAFLAANVFGYLLVSEMMKRLAAEETKLKARLNGREGLEDAKSKAAHADEVRQWIDANLKAPPSDEDRDTYLDRVISETLTAGLDVELSKRSTMETVMTGEHFVKSRFRITAKGPWQDVKEFLWRLQKPEEFRFIPRVSMIPRKNELDDSVQLVEVSLEIEKWWPKPDDYEDSPPADPAIEQPAGDAVQPTVTDNSNPSSPAATTTTTEPPPPTPEPPPPPASPTEPSPAVVTPPAPPSTPETPTDPPSS